MWTIIFLMPIPSNAQNHTSRKTGFATNAMNISAIVRKITIGTAPAVCIARQTVKFLVMAQVIKKTTGIATAFAIRLPKQLKC